MRPSSGRFGITDPDRAAGLAVPVSGIAGDQQAALFGQACFTPGMTKNTYGTGSFVLVNLGGSHPPPVDGLLTTVAWQLGDTVTYAMEGSIFVTGAAVQWLRDGLGIIDAASEAGPLAASVDDTDGVVFVPAFTGLGSPWFDPYARGAVFGLTRGTHARAPRARLRSRRWRGRPPTSSTRSRAAAGIPVTELRVDGGASAMDVLCQFQADVLGVTVRRPANPETTVLGAASLAGIAEGVWASPAEAAAAWREEAAFAPRRSPDPDRTPRRVAPRRRPCPPGPTATPSRVATGDVARPCNSRAPDRTAGGQPSLVRARLMPRTAWPMRCSFSTRAKRTKPSPPGPKPTPGDTATFASRTSNLANSRLPIGF